MQKFFVFQTMYFSCARIYRVCETYLNNKKILLKINMKLAFVKIILHRTIFAGYWLTMVHKNRI